jgi:hypothetical protein
MNYFAWYFIIGLTLSWLVLLTEEGEELKNDMYNHPVLALLSIMIVSIVWLPLILGFRLFKK